MQDIKQILLFLQNDVSKADLNWNASFTPKAKRIEAGYAKRKYWAPVYKLYGGMATRVPSARNLYQVARITINFIPEISNPHPDFAGARDMLFARALNLYRHALYIQVNYKIQATGKVRTTFYMSAQQLKQAKYRIHCLQQYLATRKVGRCGFIQAINIKGLRQERQRHNKRKAKN